MSAIVIDQLKVLKIEYLKVKKINKDILIMRLKLVSKSFSEFD